MTTEDALSLGAFHAEGRVLYVLVTGDLPWNVGFAARFEKWLHANPRGARRALRKRQMQSKLIRGERRLTATAELARALVAWWPDFAVHDPHRTEAAFLADAIVADYKTKHPVPSTCDFCDRPRQLLEVRPDAYSTSVRSICAECFSDKGRVQYATVGPAIALFVELSAVESAETAETLTDNGVPYSVRNGRQVPLRLVEESVDDGFQTLRLASNGRPQGARSLGSVRVPEVLSKLAPRFSIEQYRAVASMKGPAVNGDGPIRDDLDRLAFEYSKVHRGNVAAFALFFGIARTHVYTRAERHRRRLQTEAA